MFTFLNLCCAPQARTFNSFTSGTLSKQNQILAYGGQPKSLLNKSLIHSFAHGARFLVCIPAGKRNNITRFPAVGVFIKNKTWALPLPISTTLGNLTYGPSSLMGPNYGTIANISMFGVRGYAAHTLPRIRQSHVLYAINKKADAEQVEGNTSNWILNPLFNISASGGYAMGLFGFLWPTATRNIEPQSMPSKLSALRADKRTMGSRLAAVKPKYRQGRYV